ncbi:unnamed protein product, partial [Tenebrio molitor]
DSPRTTPSQNRLQTRTVSLNYNEKLITIAPQTRSCQDGIEPRQDILPSSDHPPICIYANTLFA